MTEIKQWLEGFILAVKKKLPASSWKTIGLSAFAIAMVAAGLAFYPTDSVEIQDGQ